MSTATVTIPTFKTVEHDIDELKVNVKYGKDGKVDEVLSVDIGDINAKPTDRFWDSLCSRYGFGPSVFRYFTHKEVFDRIKKHNLEHDGDKHNLRFTIQTSPSTDGKWDEEFKPILLGVSNPKKPILEAGPVTEVLNRLVARKVEYREGMLISYHEPRNAMTFKIGEDPHETRLCLETPIDGYGKPSVWLSLLRTICTNGAVAYSNGFHAGVNLGMDESGPATLERVMEAYNNEDGFVGLKQRIESAQNSWASMYECQRLSKTFWKLENGDFKPEWIKTEYGAEPDKVEKDTIRNDILTTFYKITGDLRSLYGVAQLDSISQKRMKQLPSKARVYDLINFATEAATHWLRPTAGRRMQGYFGDMIGQEYDLEGSGDTWKEFTDFNLASSKAAMN